MSEATDKTIALNVRLMPSESSARDEPLERRPVPADCRCRFRLHRANVACRYRKDREGWPGRAERIGRHACHPRGDGVDVLARLHQQIQQVLVGLSDPRQPKPKA
jgi:hypothetical protein